MKNKVLIIILILGLIIMGTGTALYMKGTTGYLTRGQVRIISKTLENARGMLTEVFTKEGKSNIPLSPSIESNEILRTELKKNIFTKEKFIGAILISIGFIIIASSIGLKFIFLQ